MANYTQSIREILQFNKRPAESLENVNDVYSIASRCLFDNMPSNVIDDQYAQRFITGFALHFMNEELGYETLPLWKIALNEKIYNSGSYINKIFANLDKEIFADYNVKNASNSGTTSGSKTGTGSLTADRDVTVASTDTGTETISETVGTESTDTYTGDDSTTLTKAGSEVHAHDGTDTLKKEGAESRQKGGTDVLAKKGSELTKRGGTDVFTKSGTETTSDSGGDETWSSSGSDNRVNSATVQSDTPQGSLQNLRSVNYDGSIAQTPHGTQSEFSINGNNVGSSFELNNTYNYMSAAQETGQTTLNAETSNEKVTTDRSSELSFDDREDSTEYGGKQSLTYGSDLDGHPDARTDETTYGGTEDLVYGKTHDGVQAERKDTTTYGSKEVVTYGKNGAGATDARTDVTDVDAHDVREIESSTTKTASNGNTLTKSGTTSDDLSQTTSNSETSSGTHSDSSNQTDYNINMEMLYRSMPLLNKVWEIFDDLFMLIF